MTNFTAARDAEFGYIVCDASIRARSFAMVPKGYAWNFDTHAEAYKQAVQLSGHDIPTRMIETPERFEEVADTLYGAAW